MSRTRGKRRRQQPLWREVLVLLVTALVLAVAVKAFLVQAFYIPSESMEPGLRKDDRILVQKVSTWFGGEPERGDVVVFRDPGDWLPPGEGREAGSPVTEALGAVGLYPEGGHLVKRVVAVAGDTVECCDDQGRISVNGHPLEEDGYVPDEEGVPCRGPGGPGCDWTSGVVPEGHLFVMGDNRAHSGDSSEHLCPVEDPDCADGPFVPVDHVVGTVFVLAWPADRFDWLTRPDTFDDVPEGLDTLAGARYSTSERGFVGRVAREERSSVE